MVKNLPAMWETQVWSLGWEDLLEKWMSTHSSILAWRSPWTEEPGGLQSMGLQRVRHDWATFTSLEGVDKGGEDGIQIKGTGVLFSNSQMELALIIIQENKNKIKTWPGIHSPRNLPSLPQPHALPHPSFSFPFLLSSPFPFSSSSTSLCFLVLPAPSSHSLQLPSAFWGLFFSSTLSLPSSFPCNLGLPPSAHVSQASPIDIASKPGKPDPLFFVPLPLCAPSYAKGIGRDEDRPEQRNKSFVVVIVASQWKVPPGALSWQHSQGSLDDICSSVWLQLLAC